MLRLTQIIPVRLEIVALRAMSKVIELLSAAHFLLAATFLPKSNQRLR